MGYISTQCYCACAPAWPADIHLLQSCRGQGSVPCLETVKSIHTSQTNWILVLKCAWSQYGLPCVIAALKSWFEDWCCWANYQFVMQRLWFWNWWQRKPEQYNVNGACIYSASLFELTALSRLSYTPHIHTDGCGNGTLLKVFFSHSFTHHWYQELAVLCFEMQPEWYMKPQTI